MQADLERQGCKVFNEGKLQLTKQNKKRNQTKTKTKQTKKKATL